MLTRDAILAELFGKSRPPLYYDMHRWLETSRRYAGFCEDNLSKIRSKIRGATEPERTEDLRAELECAAILCQASSLSVAYETYIAQRQRGPDFTVTWKGHTHFNVEVRRVRVPDALAADDVALDRRLMEILCDKLAQLPPSIANVLWLVADAPVTFQRLTSYPQLVEQTNQTETVFFNALGFRDRKEYEKHRARLSAIVLNKADGRQFHALPGARHALPPALANILRKL